MLIKGVVSMLDKVEVILVLGKLWAKNILDSSLLACLFIDNY